MNIGIVLNRQGKHDEGLEVYEEALGIYTRAHGVDSRQCASVHYLIAEAKRDSGDVAGALDSIREAVRINTMHGVNDSISLQAANLLRQLEGAR